MDNIDTLNNDRFELLSAYLDHEVSAEERKQVEQWLTNDSEFYALYQSLLTLQRSCQSLPTPSAAPVNQTIDRVFERIDSRRRLPLWSTLAAAAVAGTVGAIAGAWNGGPLSPQFAENQDSGIESPVVASVNPPATTKLPSQETVEPSGLMIAIEHPPVELPAAIDVSNIGAERD
ncbi:MAG: zf-HC2 domain-containing protein [Cyanobacteria bacterium P01_A01_bin.17]